MARFSFPPLQRISCKTYKNLNGSNTNIKIVPSEIKSSNSNMLKLAKLVVDRRVFLSSLMSNLLVTPRSNMTNLIAKCTNRIVVFATCVLIAYPL